MEIKKVGVLGCGLMGSGIAQIAAASGREVVVREVSQEIIDKGLKGIDRSLGKFVESSAVSIVLNLTLMAAMLLSRQYSKALPWTSLVPDLIVLPMSAPATLVATPL